MNYFDPKNLTQLQGTYNYTTLSGVGFGVTEANERIFLNARTVDVLKLNVGDTIRVWAVDNYANADTNHYPSRWRAVRAEVIARLEESVANLPHVTDTPAPAPQHAPAATATLEKFIETPAVIPDTAIAAALTAALDTATSAVVPVVAPAPPAASTGVELLDYIRQAIDAGVPVTAKAIGEAACAQGYVHSKAGLTTAIINRLACMHRTGEVSLLRIYSKEGNIASAVYYAKNINVLRDYLDTPLAADQ